ncbi:MAG: IS66 family transposase [Candidatus Rifleibacteriota bacterium]
MKLAVDKLPDDPKFLKEVIVEISNETSLLKEQVALLKQMIFGRKSEKLQLETAPSQLHFDFGEEDSKETSADNNQVESTIEIPSHKRRKRGRKPLSDELPRVERIIDIPEKDKLCECGCKKSIIGKETSEQLEYIPAKCNVIVNVRPKYACRNCEGTESSKPAVMIAPPPAQIIPKSFATASLLAYIITSKHVDALPFYRLSNMFSRHGVQLSRATMCNWILKVASLLKPMIELFLEQIIDSSYFHADETPLQVLKEPGRRADQKSYVWVFKTGSVDRPTILFNYSPSRAGKIPKQIFKDFKGYIQTDGYIAYNYIEDNEDQIQLACWAHVRRKFVSSIKAVGKNAEPGIAHKAYEIIKKLYKTEKEAVEKKLSFEQIKELRQREAKPLLEEFKKKLTIWKDAVVPGSNTGKAINYALGQWNKLLVYLEDGRLKIDNNSAENAIRPFAVGRKNWLFSNTPQGARASATIYSITETAKANGLEPFWYMCALLKKLPELKTKEDFNPWMPQNIDKQIVEDLRKRHQNPES